MRNNRLNQNLFGRTEFKHVDPSPGKVTAKKHASRGKSFLLKRIDRFAGNHSNENLTFTAVNTHPYPTNFRPGRFLHPILFTTEATFRALESGVPNSLTPYWPLRLRKPLSYGKSVYRLSSQDASVVGGRYKVEREGLMEIN